MSSEDFQNTQQVLSTQVEIQKNKPVADVKNTNKMFTIFGKLTDEFQEKRLSDKIKKSNKNIPQNTNIKKLVEVIEEAKNEIPKSETRLKNLENIEITHNKKGVDGNTKISVKDFDVINHLVRKVDFLSGMDVFARKSDLRLISNVNRIQLRYSKQKLYVDTYTFKSVTISEKRYNRILLSFDVDDLSKVLVFMQSSRDKCLFRVNFDIDFLSKIISEYFIVGYEASKKNVALYISGQMDNLKPSFSDDKFSQLYEKIMLTGNYRLQKAGKNSLENADFSVISRRTNYHWLAVNFKYVENGKCSVFATSSIYKDRKIFDYFGRPVSIEALLEPKFMEYLEHWFTNYDYGNIHAPLHEFLSKLTHNTLKIAIEQLETLANQYPELEIEIIKTLGKRELNNIEIKGRYDAEAIVGRTKNMKYFIITYNGLNMGLDARGYKTLIMMTTMELVDFDGKVTSYTKKYFDPKMHKLLVDYVSRVS